MKQPYAKHIREQIYTLEMFYFKDGFVLELIDLVEHHKVMFLFLFVLIFVRIAVFLCGNVVHKCLSPKYLLSINRPEGFCWVGS